MTDIFEDTVVEPTRCVCCKRLLTDPESIFAGIGPECRRKYAYTPNLTSNEALAIELVRQAAICRHSKEFSKVYEACDQLRKIGMQEMAQKVISDISKAIVTKENQLLVDVNEAKNVIDIFAPFRLNASFEWRKIGGAFDKARKCWSVQLNGITKKDVWGVLQMFYSNMHGIGPKGAFVVNRKATS